MSFGFVCLFCLFLLFLESAPATLDIKEKCLVAAQAYYLIIRHSSQKVVEIHALLSSFFKFLLFPNTFFNRKNIFLNFCFQCGLLFSQSQTNARILLKTRCNLKELHSSAS